MGKAATPVNSPNNVRNFYPSDDKWELKMLPIVASVAMVDGTALRVQVTASSPTGNLNLAVATNATGQNFAWILAEPIATTDTDYATAGKLKWVWVPKTVDAESYFSVGAGTFTLADVGRVCSLHTDWKSLAVDTNGAGAVISWYISASKGKCRFNVPSVVTS